MSERRQFERNRNVDTACLAHLACRASMLLGRPVSSSDAMSLQGYRNGPATQGSALFGASQLGASQDEYGFTQDLNFTQDGTASFSDYPQFTGLSQVDACWMRALCKPVADQNGRCGPPPLPSPSDCRCLL